MGYQLPPEFGKVLSAWFRFSPYLRQQLDGVEDPKLQDPNLLSFSEFLDELRPNQYRLAVNELVSMDIGAKPLMDMGVTGDGTRLAEFTEWIHYAVVEMTELLEDPKSPQPNGPDGRGRFWHNKVPHEPTPMNMSLIKALHEKGWVRYEVLGRRIWDDSGTCADTIQSCVTRTNNWFRKKELPYFVETGENRLRLNRNR